jgi:DNA-binding PucR family transcriptional regulator
MIVVLAGAGRSPGRDPRTLAEELKAGLEATVGAGVVTIAIGDRCTRPDAYAPAFRLARDAVELMLKLGRRGAIVGAGELGPYGLLLRASSRDELDSFARRTLRPLVEHDRAHGGELLATLRAYLEEDRVQRRVAARCFIHVNTVVYRIHRIEELLGVDLGDPGAVFDLTLALRIDDLLSEPPDRDGR